MKKVTHLLVGIIAAISTSASCAAVLFEHQFPTSDLGLSFCSSCNGNYQEFDQFKLFSDANISQIDARLSLFGTTSLQYIIFDDLRTTELYSDTFALSSLRVTSLLNSVYDVSASFTGLTLGAGSYYLSILGDSSGSTGWFMSDGPGEGKSVQTLNNNIIVRGGNRTNLAFRVVGSPISITVPEPATIGLIALGLLCFGARRPKSLCKPFSCSLKQT